MRCQSSQYFFPGVPSVIGAKQGEETAVQEGIIAFRAVDRGNTFLEIFQCCLGVRAVFNDRKKKLFFRILSVKELINGHSLKRQHNRNMVIVRYLPKDFCWNVGIHDHLSVSRQPNQFCNLKFRQLPVVAVNPGGVFLRASGYKMLPGRLGIHVTDIGLPIRFSNG